MSKSLEDSITTLSGVGDKRAQTVATLGIETIEDLLTFYPFRYDDIQERNVLDIVDQEKVVLKGKVVRDPVVNHYGFKKNKLSFSMMQDHAVITVSFFNQHYLKDSIHAGEEIAVFGKWDAKRRSLNGMKVMTKNVDSSSDFSPIYHVTKEVRQSTLVKLIHQAFDTYIDVIPEVIPQKYRDAYRLMPRPQAMYEMHFPSSEESVKQAKRTLVYEEFFFFQLQMQRLKQSEMKQESGQVIAYNIDELNSFILELPYELTGAQKRVVNEICRDLKSNQTMYRLLQGDVGSGKTMVAAIVLFAVVDAGFQGVLMVPTEILAEQHLVTLKKLFATTTVTISSLTGSTKTSERRQILEELANGSINIVVGTHALIQDGVHYNNLGLVITDEQHRFGVNQRKALREKGIVPNVLFMTATPIPRTLAISAFGDMSISTIDELPPGRQPISTKWYKPSYLLDLLKWIKKELSLGHQAYIVCPLIEESDAMDLKNATQLFQELDSFFSPEFSVGLLHGKMKNDEKEDIMGEFKKGTISVLVSTTVIEVGVDVPNATIMMIMDADRFGLAQLHQLRGRVGRGSDKSYCLLIADPKNDNAKERMLIMTDTNDGFVLSQKDLEMRGPGEFFGTRQSGLPQFSVGDIVQDENIMSTAQNDVIALMMDEEFWASKEGIILSQRLEYFKNTQTSVD